MARKYGAYARQRALQDYTWKNIAGQYLDFFRQLLQNRDSFMKLLIISHTPHYLDGSTVVGWGPTIREIDYLSELFTAIVHIAPLHPGPVPDSSLPYSSKNIRFRAVPSSGGENLPSKIGILKAFPAYFHAFTEEAAKADAIHVRCPANISLAALLWLTLHRHPQDRWVKYAGNWHPEGNEPLSYRLQRYYLLKNLHHGAVTINGRWPGQPPHVHSFYNPCLTAEELIEGRKAAAVKEIGEPINLLFVGRLEKGKGVDRALRVAGLLKKAGVPFHFDMIGDGPERLAYEKLASENEVKDFVDFQGWMPKMALAKFYAKSHLLILPSLSEGWPKVISEAMAYGVIPLASEVSSIPQILEELHVGQALPLDDTVFASKIIEYAENPKVWSRHRDAAVLGAPHFSYKKYQEAVTRLLHIPLSKSPETQ